MLETSLVYTFVKQWTCMLAYHTLHVLKDVQIENQHEKTKTLLNIWSITYFITEGTHFKRQLIESMHEDPVGYISP